MVDKKWKERLNEVIEKLKMLLSKLIFATKKFIMKNKNIGIPNKIYSLYNHAMDYPSDAKRILSKMEKLKEQGSLNSGGVVEIQAKNILENLEKLTKESKMIEKSLKGDSSKLEDTQKNLSNLKDQINIINFILHVCRIVGLQNMDFDKHEKEENYTQKFTTNSLLLGTTESYISFCYSCQ